MLRQMSRRTPSLLSACSGHKEGRGGIQHQLDGGWLQAEAATQLPQVGGGHTAAAGWGSTQARLNNHAACGIARLAATRRWLLCVP